MAVWTDEDPAGPVYGSRRVVVTAQQTVSKDMLDRLVVGKERGLEYLLHYAQEEAAARIRQEKVDDPHLVDVGVPLVTVRIEYALTQED